MTDPGGSLAAALGAGLAAATAWLLVSPVVALGRAGPLDRRRLGAAPALVAVPLLGLAAIVLDLHGFLLLLLGALVLLVVARGVRRQRSARDADQRADQVLALCEAMASDLAAGQPPLSCLERAADDWPEFAPVATAGRMGADVPDLLRELALRPGAGQLRTMAATWQVAHETGTGLAHALHQAGAAIRSERRVARLVAGELSAARATARMLAVLPLFVLLLGAGLGGDPVGFLLGTSPGLGLLAAGLGLSLAGMLWLERIADRVLSR